MFRKLEKRAETCEYDRFSKLGPGCGSLLEIEMIGKFPECRVLVHKWCCIFLHNLYGYLKVKFQNPKGSVFPIGRRFASNGGSGLLAAGVGVRSTRWGDVVTGGSQSMLRSPQHRAIASSCKFNHTTRFCPQMPTTFERELGTKYSIHDPKLRVLSPESTLHRILHRNKN